MDLWIFCWGRPGSNRGPLGLRQFLTVCPAKTVKKVAEWSEARLRAELHSVIFAFDQVHKGTFRRYSQKNISVYDAYHLLGSINGKVFG